MSAPVFTHFHGLRIVRDASLVDVVEDWSRVRSPGRARRRRRRGHRQNIRFVRVPQAGIYIAHAYGVLVGHPETIDAMLRAIDSFATEPRR